MKHMVETVDVVLDWHSRGALQLVGQLHRQATRGAPVVAFEYAREWLQQARGLALDPDLSLMPGRSYPPHQRTDFGLFLDSAPDRWGRMLLQRRENWQARHEGRKPKSLREWDFLLGVEDVTRLGGLRFRRSPTAPWLATDAELSVPPLSHVRELAATAALVEADTGAATDDEEGRWLKQLCAPGSSLGGARPKAVVLDEQGHLCLAKFPGRQDRTDVAAWEHVANLLARRAGIDVPETQLLQWGQTGSTLLIKRFDRTPLGGRIHYASAMTLLARRDGEGGASYLELAELLMRQGARPTLDAVELFRRALFNVAVSNTDDHLRNHGFLLTERGWALAPAFDVNPNPEGGAHALALDELTDEGDLDTVMSARKSYGVSDKDAKASLTAVLAAISDWRAVAERAGIARRETERYATAFLAAR